MQALALQEDPAGVIEPRGFGIGIPTNSDYRHRHFPNEADLLAYIYAVEQRLQPDWSYLWTGGIYPTTRQVFLTIRPPNQWEEPQQLASYILDHLPDGVDPNMRTWMLLCEPGNTVYGGWSVEEAIMFANETLAEFGRRRPSGLWSYHFISPNENINGVNGEWLRAYWREVRHSSKKFYFGVHFWGKWGYRDANKRWIPGLEVHWRSLLAWMRSIGQDSVYITEAGPGGDTTYDESVSWLRQAERVILAEPEVSGLALTGATHTWDGRMWPGLLDEHGNLTPFGIEWMALRQRSSKRRGYSFFAPSRRTA